MATRHGTLSANFSNNGVVGTGITLKSTEYPTKISACSSNATFKGSGTKAVMHLYFSNSGGTNIADILSFTSNNQYQYTFMGPNAPDLHKKALGSISGIQSLKGTTLYLKVSTTTGSGTYTGASGATITIETNLSVGAHAVGTVTLAQDGAGKLKVSWSNVSAGTNNGIKGYTVYLSTSSGGSAASGLSTTVTSTANSGSYTFTTNNTTTYYAAVKALSDVDYTYDSPVKWSSGQAAYMYTKCGAPSSVTLSRTKGTVTITWSGASGGTNNSISSYSIIQNTSASESGATSVNSALSSTASNANTTNAPGAGTFYYAVRTQGSAGSSWYSPYKWSGSIAVPSKPSVSAGTVITDTQMDTLRTWINTSGITDIADGSSVKASEGNTYRNTLTAGASKIEASWYNTAAN